MEFGEAIIFFSYTLTLPQLLVYREGRYMLPAFSAAGGGIRRIVLAATTSHAIGRVKLRRHQFDSVAVLTEQSRLVVRTLAGFHADQARWQLLGQRQQLGAILLA